VIELEHGIWRARTAEQAAGRQTFLDDLFGAVPVHPLTFSIARLAARIDGESRRKGIQIPFQDLAIGATALEFGYDRQSSPFPDDPESSGKAVPCACLIRSASPEGRSKPPT
jgi:hypothetical protein